MDETLNIVRGEWNCFLCTFATDTNLVLMEHIQLYHFRLNQLCEPEIEASRSNDNQETNRDDIGGAKVTDHNDVTDLDDVADYGDVADLEDVTYLDDVSDFKDDSGALDVTDHDGVTKGEDDKSRFGCSHCPRTYLLKASLMKHLRKVKDQEAKTLSHHKKRNSCSGKKKMADLKSNLARRKLGSILIKLVSPAKSRRTKTISSSKNAKGKAKRQSFDSEKPTRASKGSELRIGLKNSKITTSFKCEHCSKSFTKKCYLDRHRSNSHLRQNCFICPICDKGFPEQGILNRHQKISHKFGILNSPRSTKNSPGKRGCSMTNPDRKTREKSQDKTGNKATTEDILFDCDQCHKSFGKKINLHRHAKFHNRTRSSNDKQNVENPKIDEHEKFESMNQESNDQIQIGKERLTCRHCTKSFSTKFNLRRHVNRKHSLLSENKVTPDPKLVNNQMRVCLKNISPKGSARLSTFVVKHIAILKKNLSCYRTGKAINSTEP